jgi:hypothetical protein
VSGIRFQRHAAEAATLVHSIVTDELIGIGGSPIAVQTVSGLSSLRQTWRHSNDENFKRC